MRPTLPFGLILNSKHTKYKQRTISSLYCKQLIRVLCIAAIAAAQNLRLHAQPAHQVATAVQSLQVDTRYYPTHTTRHLRPWQSLNLRWVLQSNGTRTVAQAPFLAKRTETLDATLKLYQQHMPQDTMYILFEALAGRPIVYLNSHVVAISHEANGSLFIPLPPERWQPGWNTLHVHLSRTASDSLDLPGSSLGIYQPAFVLSRHAMALSDTSQVRWPVPAAASPAPTLTWLNLKTATLLPDSLWAQQMRVQNQAKASMPSDGHPLVQLKPYPGRAVVRRLQQMGFRWQPVAAVPTPHTPGGTSLPAFMSNKPLLSRPQAIAIVLLPLLLMVAWRLYDITSFRLVLSISVQRAKTFEMISQNIFLRPTLLLLVSALRIALVAGSLVFWYYLHVQQGANVAWPVQPASLAHVFLTGKSQEPIQLFGLLLAGFGIVNITKYTLLHLLGRIYSRRYFLERMLALEAYAYLPWLALLFSLGFVMHILPAAAITAIYFITLGGFVFFVLRKYYIFITGLSQALRIPLSIIFLYICTLEIVPWFWLLLN